MQYNYEREREQCVHAKAEIQVLKSSNDKLLRNEIIVLLQPITDNRMIGFSILSHGKLIECKTIT